MIFFLLVNTKGDILKNVLAVCPYYKKGSKPFKLPKTWTKKA